VISLHPIHSQLPTASDMTKWEYSRIDLNTLSRSETELDALNHAGAQGWELVTINNCNIALFKRAVPAPKVSRASAAASALAREK
jgi:hypothetical protein